MRKLSAIAALLMAGCATTGGQDMTAEQLRALVADKNFSAVCSTVTGIYGTGKFVYVNVDRSVVGNGAISVDANCLVTMSNAPVPRNLAPTAPAVNVPLPLTVTPHVVNP